MRKFLYNSNIDCKNDFLLNKFVTNLLDILHNNHHKSLLKSNIYNIYNR